MKRTPRLIYFPTIMAALVQLAGCGAPRLVQVKTPVPVECREAVPARPVMPTELLLPTADVDQYVQAAGAEIPRREAYEVVLLAALVACTATFDATGAQVLTEGSSGP